MKKRFLISLCLILAIVGIITSCSFGGNSNNGENNDNKLSAEEIYAQLKAGMGNGMTHTSSPGSFVIVFHFIVGFLPAMAAWYT